MSEKAKIKAEEVIAKKRFTLKKVTFDVQKKDGQWQTQDREVYDIGNAATVLLYNKEQNTVILTKQFRLVTFLNGNPNGLLLETCAGKLEKDSPEEGMIREIKEETGYQVTAIKKIFEAYLSPGSIIELVHFFIAEYNASMKVSEGGGLKEEQEDIEVLELSFTEALRMLNNGEIKDGKTIILLQYAQLHNLLSA